KRRARFRADAKPVDTGRRGEGAIGFDGNFEAPGVDRADQRRIQLEQWLAPGENHKTVRSPARPNTLNRRGKCCRLGKASTARTIGAHKIRITEAANGLRAIFFLAGPEIASGKSAKYGGAPGVRTFALQGEKDLLRRIFAHRPAPILPDAA